MYLVRMKILAQGTPIYEVESGYKDCKMPAMYRATYFDGRTVCPGCARLCRLPAGQCAQGDPIIIRRRTEC